MAVVAVGEDVFAGGEEDAKIPETSSLSLPSSSRSIHIISLPHVLIKTRTEKDASNP